MISLTVRTAATKEDQELVKNNLIVISDFLMTPLMTVTGIV